jgi:hypothetical protein
VTPARDLDPAGQVVQVTGQGYDTAKGIYVAFCVVPPPGQLPSPCGGGAGPGAQGAARWITSNPPPYGEGLAQPYGPGGSFSTTLVVSPTIGTVDCRTTACAVVTRNDHTRTADRSQDLLVPVTFAAGPPPPAPPAPPPSAAPPAGAPGPTVPAAGAPVPEAPRGPAAAVAPPAPAAGPTTTEPRSTSSGTVAPRSTTTAPRARDVAAAAIGADPAVEPAGDEGGSGRPAAVAAGLGGTALAGALGTLWWRRRRAAGP